MTLEEALYSIEEDGIRLNAGDFVDVEALKVAAKVLRKVIAGRLVEPGYGWISVEERLPETEVDVLVFAAGDSMYVGTRTAGLIWLESAELNSIYGVTHWMPLPKPPKEAENDI